MSNKIPDSLISLDYDKNLPELNFNSKCKACTLSTGKAVCGSIGFQDLTNMKLVVISDYPGHYEETFNYCMYSNEDKRQSKRGSNKGWPNAGNYIRTLLATKFNLDTYREVYFTNAVKCNPRKVKPDINKQIKKCINEWLLKELVLIDDVNPQVPIMLLGDTVFKAFSKAMKNGPFLKLGGSPKMKDARRKVWFYKEHPIVVTVNPAAVASAGYKLERSDVSSSTSMVYTYDLPTLVGNPQWHYEKDLEILRQYI